MFSRRQILSGGGGLLVALAAGRSQAQSDKTVDVAMQGTPDGSRVWFDPIGLLVSPGQTIRWTNRDRGNSHTVTAYHPAIDGRPLRIPEGAEPWDSGYLLPDETFSVTLTVEGVYDYYCIPHEHAGMVGRIIVGKGAEPMSANPADESAVPEIALRNFPAVADIIAQGAVHFR